MVASASMVPSLSAMEISTSPVYPSQTLQESGKDIGFSLLDCKALQVSFVSNSLRRIGGISDHTIMRVVFVQTGAVDASVDDLGV